MDVKFIIELYRHMEWADAAVWRSVLKSEPAREDAKLREYLYHLHTVQRAFLRIWTDGAIDMSFPTFVNAQQLMVWGQTYFEEAFAYLETMSDEKIAEALTVPWAESIAQRIGQSPEVTTIGETMLQVALHSTYHRGQVNARLREAGGEPPQVDYIAWLWLGRPQADWPVSDGNYLIVTGAGLKNR
jgi:uncharacterized damage-inducible protein DinB